MCSFCGKEPCDYRCPNTDDTPIGRCDWCKDVIYSNEEIYTDDSDGLYCSKQCAIHANGIRVLEENDYYEN